ncbi:MAG: cyclic nucleotide-binding domain-containing protein [Thioploca sp.]|nr:cyclic nucleotide-binding domain-containing protein [Thioploca sp.]
MTSIFHSLFKLERGEEKLVVLNFLQAVLIGLPRLFTMTVASALFLEKYSADKLPYVFIASALLVALIGLVHLNLDRYISFIRLQSSSLLFLALASASFIALLWILPDAGWPLFLLWVWFDIEWILTNIVFWGTANRLFTARQGKRLFGLVGAGEIFTMVIGGLLAPWLVGLLGTRNLLWFSLVGLVLAFFNLNYLHHNFRLKFVEPQSHDAIGGQPVTTHTISLRDLFKIRYVILIFLFYAFLRHVIDYFLNNLFFAQVNSQYPNADQVAGFMGQFLAILGFFSLFFRLFISSYWLTRLGLFISLITVPLLVIIGSVMVTGTAHWFNETILLFWLVVGIKALKDLLAGSVTFPAYYMLYQPLSYEQRGRVQTTAETIVGPVLGIIAGIFILLLLEYFRISPIQLAPWLAAIAILWLVIGVLANHEYRRTLTALLKLWGESRTPRSTDEAWTLEILTRNLAERPPTELRYCLELLEQIQTPLIRTRVEHLLLELLGHADAEVRTSVYASLERLAPTNAFIPLRSRLEVEDVIPAKVALLRALAATEGQVEAIENSTIPTHDGSSLAPFTSESLNLISAYLASDNLELQRGAMVALILHGGMEGVVKAGPFLIGLEESADPQQRAFAAEVLGELGLASLYRTLAPLLLDDDLQVRHMALQAAGRLNNPRLWPLVIENLQWIGVRESAVQTLIQAGASALPALEAAYPTQSTPVRRQIIRIYGRIQHPQAISLLYSNFEEADRNLRQEILWSLHQLHYQAPDQARIDALLHEEVEYGNTLMVASVELDGPKAMELLHTALDYELEKTRVRVFLLLSFIYAPDLIARIRYHSDTDLRDLALELFDTVIYKKHKHLIAPLLFGDTTVTPQHQPLERIKDMLAHPNRWNNPWLIACAIEAADAALKMTMDNLRHHLAPLLEVDNALIRETARYTTQLLGREYLGQLHDQPQLHLPTIEKVRLLQHFSLFAELPAEILAEEAELFEEVVVASGETLLHQGQAGNAMYVIAEGSLRVHDNEQTLAELGPGQSFGELKALEPKARTTSITAQRRSYLFQLTHDNLQALEETRIEVARSVLKYLHTRLYELTAQHKLPLSLLSLPAAENEQQPIPPTNKVLEPLSLLEKLIIFKGTTVFTNTSDDFLSELAQLAQERYLHSGQSLFKAGETDMAFYLVVEGALILYDGEQPLGLLGQRMSMGEISLLLPISHLFSATAVGETRLLVLHHQTVVEPIRERHEVIRGIIQTLVQRLREAKQ